MRIVHISFNDAKGGAAKIAYYLHQELKNLGVDSHMAVIRKTDTDETIHSLERPIIRRIASQLNLWPFRFHDSPKSLLSCSINGILHAEKKIQELKPDIVHFHWIGQSFVSITQIRRILQKYPCVWTLHDMNPFTGGCHYSWGCERFTKSCGNCPQLSTHDKADITNRVMLRKSTWPTHNLTVISPSRWLTKCAKRSSLFSKSRCLTIHNGIELIENKSLSENARMNIRKIRHLPLNKRIIVFGAEYPFTDPRKGWNVLCESLKNLRNPQKWLVIVFGKGSLPKMDHNVNCVMMGQLPTTDVNEIISCADVTALPSIHENLATVGIESLMNGTPIVAFDIGGMSDIIDHTKTGYLVPAFDTGEFARALEKIVEKDTESAKNMRKACILKAKKFFTITKMAKSYMQIYQESYHDAKMRSSRP